MPELRLYRGKWAEYTRENGRSVRRSLGTADRAEALAVLEEAKLIETRRAAGAATFADLWARYLDSLEGRPTATTMRFMGRAILPHFGALRPIAITHEIVTAYREARVALGRKPGAIRSELNKVASTLNWAVKRGLLDKAPHISRPAPPPPKERYLTKDEIRKLLGACATPHMKLFVMLAATTGARAGALLDLTWDRVDFDRGLIRLARPDQAATMKGRAVAPMNGSARTALAEARKTANGPFVIQYGGQKVQSIKTAFRGACRRAGLAGVGPHTLRHSAAIILAESRVPMSEIAQMLGHKDTRTTEAIYARFSPDYLRTSAAALDL